MELQFDFEFIERVILGCTKKEHMRPAHKLIILFKNKYNNARLTIILADIYRERINEFKNTTC